MRVLITAWACRLDGASRRCRTMSFDEKFPLRRRRFREKSRWQPKRLVKSLPSLSFPEEARRQVLMPETGYFQAIV